MSEATPFNHNSSVSVGGSVTDSVIQTGNENIATVQFQKAALPQRENVNIQAEVAALRELLLQLQTPDQRKIERAFEDVEEELEKPEPDKDEIGQALDRAVNYAQKANGFAEAINKLRPHIEKLVAWLGGNWYKLLSLVGLAV